MTNDLTPHELRIMDLVISGYQDKETASILGIKPKTVLGHMDRIKDKLGAKTRAQAAAIYAAQVKGSIK